MTNRFNTADGLNYRSIEREKVERIHELSREVKQLRAKGLTSNLSSKEREISEMKRELGIKPKTASLTPTERKAKISNLKERLKNANSR